MSEIKKVLIANRGEIAHRIALTCKKMCIKTVAIYSEEDRNLPYVQYADESYCLEGKDLEETYLNIKKIIEIANLCSADAIHPGYGFLAENATFSEEVNKAGLIFIGPDPKVIALMGEKIESRIKMGSLGIPLPKGYHGKIKSDEHLLKLSEDIGFPIMIKAASGGGGRAMRYSHNQKDLLRDFHAVENESIHLFGNNNIYIEQYLENCRHIEIQILCDQHGNHLHLYERDCSLQRRHQKICEESPARKLSSALLNQLYSAATTITKSVEYFSAGTVEFLVDQHEKFYFLEMNTRIQVEHGVTEMLTGIDIVKCQIEIAEHKKLSFKQSDICRNGHAIEVRIYAEDTDNNFLPSGGNIKHTSFTNGLMARYEPSYQTGNDISAKYDSLIAKMVAWGANRREAALNLKHNLNALNFQGPINNKKYLLELITKIEKDNLIASTDWIEKNPLVTKDEKLPLSIEKKVVLIAAYLHNKYKLQNPEKAAVTQSHLWNSEPFASFRNIQ